MNLKLALGGALLGVAAIAAASDAKPGKPKVQTYSAKAIYALSFHGLRLGMTFEQACQTLIGQGFSRRPFDFPDDPPCSRKHLFDANSETYFGSGWTLTGESKPNPIRDVKFIGISYIVLDGELRVREFDVYTDEPKREQELATRVVSEWGEPSQHDRWGYQVMTYAPSRTQSDFYNRSNFVSCSIWDGCDDKTGPACHRIVNRYAVPYAQQVIYDWGRYIRVEDGSLTLLKVRRERLLEKMLNRNIRYACPIPTIH